MQKIKYLKNIKGHLAGDIEYVENNDAHTLIDSRLAVLTREDKQMLSDSDKKEKRFITK